MNRPITETPRALEEVVLASAGADAHEPPRADDHRLCAADADLDATVITNALRPSGRKFGETNRGL